MDNQFNDSSCRGKLWTVLLVLTCRVLPALLPVILDVGEDHLYQECSHFWTRRVKKNIYIGTGWKMIVFIEVFMSYKSVLTFYNFCHFDFMQGVLMSHRTVNDSSNVMVWHQK